MKIDKSKIKELSDYLDEFNLTEIEITEKDTKIKVSKNNVSNQLVATSANIHNENENVSKKPIIKCPIVGTAYLSPEPGAKPFVSIGKKIKKGETLLIVEAMKTMNHVPSTKDGVIKKVCVEDGQPVEFGQTIIVLE